MSQFLIYPPTLPKFETFCYYSKAFTEKECDSLIELYETLSPSDALIGGEKEDGSGGVLDHNKRKSTTRWLPWSHEHNWIFEKLTSLLTDANNVRYRFDLTGFLEPLQLTEYTAPGGHYDWHQDFGPGTFSIRKLSLVLQLSPPESYEGGDLEFYRGRVPEKERGTVYVFPSFEQHRVTPLSSGLRRSLVCWVSGPPFR